MDPTITKPRQLAARMIDGFVAGGQVQINPEDYPKPIRAHAITQARNAAAIIVHHARAARKDPQHTNQLPKELAALVYRYNTSMAKRAAA